MWYFFIFLPSCFSETLRVEPSSQFHAMLPRQECLPRKYLGKDCYQMHIS